MDVDPPAAKPVVLERSQRAGRAARLAELLKGGGSDESEDDFWGEGGAGAELFGDDPGDEDESFGSDDEESAEDEVDSDFDAPEVVVDPANEAAAPVKVNDLPTKKSVYKDPALLKARKEAAEKKSAKKTKPVSEEPAAPKRVYVPVPPRNSERPSLRETTKQLTAAVVARKKATEEKAKMRPPKAPKIIKTYTQEELLEESKETAKLNQASLLELMKYEENMKRIELKKRAIDGPKVRYVSKNGVNTITFTDVDRFPPELVQDPCNEYPNKRVCAITGKPAKYFDPLTRQPYADIKSFQILRANFESEKTRMEQMYLASLTLRPQPHQQSASSTSSTRATMTGSSELSAGGRTTRSNASTAPAPSPNSHTAPGPSSALSEAGTPAKVTPKTTASTPANSSTTATKATTATTPTAKPVSANPAASQTSSTTASSTSTATIGPNPTTSTPTAKPTVVAKPSGAAKLASPKTASSIAAASPTAASPKTVAKVSTAKPTPAVSAKTTSNAATPTASIAKTSVAAAKRVTPPAAANPKDSSSTSTASKPSVAKSASAATAKASAAPSNKMEVDEPPKPTTAQSLGRS